MFVLKPPLKVNCWQCQKKLAVNFCPPRQNYSQKNHWGYWTGKKENQGQYRCDACLIGLYRHHKLVYLESITDSKKRRTFRTYFSGKLSSPLLTKTQQEDLEKSELHNILKKRRVNLDKGGLGDYLESWRQIVFKLVQENSLQAKKIGELERMIENQKKKKKKKNENLTLKSIYTSKFVII